MFEQLSEKFNDAFKNLSGKGHITERNIENALKEVRTALLQADVDFQVVKDFIATTSNKALGKKITRGVNPKEQFIKIVQDELTAVMEKGQKTKEIDFDTRSPMIILSVGLNGQGKTTFSGKLAHFVNNKKGKKVLLVPADNIRPAAKEQLEILSKTVGVDMFDSNLTMHPKDIVSHGMAFARKNNHETVIIDTAGRPHVDDNLMDQLKEIKKVIKEYNHEVLLVADAMTGQEASSIAQSFHEAVGLTGVVLSKMDSDARGGAALSIGYTTGVPIRFLSVGEKPQDLDVFYPDRLAQRILDMGDVVSLVEKAEEAVDKKEAEEMMEKMKKGQFSVTMLMKQMDMMSKIGNMGSIIKMLPGAGKLLNQFSLSTLETEMKKMRVIVNSMTKSEREN